MRLDRRKFLLSQAPWCVDNLCFEENNLIINGWAVPRHGFWDQVDFLCDGIKFDEVEYPKPRDDLLEVFPYWEDAGLMGFKCVLYGVQKAINKSFWEFSCISEGQQNLFHSYFYPYDFDKEQPIPYPQLRYQVHGSKNLSSFFLEGYSAVHKLEAILADHGKDSLRNCGPLLDWGCGCGRLTRFLDFPGLQVHGADIVSESVKWCQNALSFGHFQVLPTKPPTKLNSDYYKTVIGVSVFTHLSEESQWLWLKELNRISVSGAILLLTVHGMHSAVRFGLTEENFHKWQTDGFMDLGINHSLEGYSRDLGCYRDTLHTRSYIEERWKHWFEVLDVVEGVVGNHQDVVILVKR